MGIKPITVSVKLSVKLDLQKWADTNDLTDVPGSTVEAAVRHSVRERIAGLARDHHRHDGPPSFVEVLVR